MSKVELTRFLALDCATTNTGFALFHKGALINYGKLYFEGSTEYEKALYAGAVMNAFLQEAPVSIIILESSYLGINPNVASNLAMSQGAVIGAAGLAGVSAVASVVPIQWQRGIGNPLLTKDEKRAIMEEYPGKSAAWYKTFGKKVRKLRTIEIVNDKFDINVRDNDVADAIGLGLFVSENEDKVKW
jgi:hypothetical protein